MHNRQNNNNDLIAQIEALQAELSRLHIALQDQQDNIAVGDTVEILNSYRNQQGIQGIVTRVTSRQAVLRDSQGVTYRRAKRNLRLVHTSNTPQ